MDKKKQELNLGLVIMFILITVNLIEFWFANAIHSFIVSFFSMGLLAVIDVALILEYYMHMPRVFASDEGSHS